MYCSKCGVPNSDEAKFCKECGVNIIEETSSLSSNATHPTHKVKAPRGILFYILTPIVAFVGITILWGIVNFIFIQNSPVLDFINNVLIPFAIGLAFLAIPIGIIYGVYSNSKYYDGTIKCGNCSYIGAGKKGRSTWAQVVVWILFFISPLITIIYYLATHKYVCPKCNSTFVGFRDVNGNFSSAKGNFGPLGIILLVLLIVAVIGILAAVVLASLNDAREAGIKASQSATETAQELKFELTDDYSILVHKDITSTNITVNGVKLGDATSKIPNSVITGQDWNGIKAGLVTYHETSSGSHESTQKLIDSISLYAKELVTIFPDEKAILTALGPAENVSENTTTDGVDYKSYDYRSRGISIVLYDFEDGLTPRLFLNEPR